MIISRSFFGSVIGGISVYDPDIAQRKASFCRCHFDLVMATGGMSFAVISRISEDHGFAQYGYTVAVTFCTCYFRADHGHKQIFCRFLLSAMYIAYFRRTVF